MNYVKYTDSPKTDDLVGFTLETYSDEGVLKNPFAIEKVVIYYIERNLHNNEKAIEIEDYHPELERAYAHLQETTQAKPDQDNLNKLAALKSKMVETAKITKVSYSEARIVMQTADLPIWVEGSKKIANIIDDKQEKVDGKFLFLWLPKDMREGTYLIRWDWKNKKDGKLQSAEKLFTLYPAEQKINSIYRQFVPREKYNFLFDKYIPKMYRGQLSANDITPDVLVKFNKSVAQSLLELDDLAVGLIDLLNPTYMPDGFLPVMANFFNIELRSSNPTAWRNQIKHAMPLFKKKGTLEGLEEALDKAEIKLLKLTNLWQVVSPYTWVDGFVISKDVDNEIIGNLSKKPLKDAEFEISIKSTETKEYFTLPNNIISFQDVLVPEPRTAVVWNNESEIKLFTGDVVRIRYTYKKIPDDARSIENYLRSLPLADQRDEKKVKYPIKNWNVKLIEEDDPLFDLLIPERHAFSNPVTFGKIRTSFLYSEKAFNMDTYNGSLYNSNNPCDIDKDFTDPCSGGQSSKFNVHLEFNQVTNEKIREAEEIITDYSPFHAVLHNIKISSKLTDFVLSPIEKIKNDVKNKPGSDKIKSSEAIYCQIRYKDGKIENGRIA